MRCCSAWSASAFRQRIQREPVHHAPDACSPDGAELREHMFSGRPNSRNGALLREASPRSDGATGLPGAHRKMVAHEMEEGGLTTNSRVTTRIGVPAVHVMHETKTPASLPADAAYESSLRPNNDCDFVDAAE